jgi:hypothetical protein
MPRLAAPASADLDHRITIARRAKTSMRARDRKRYGRDFERRPEFLTVDWPQAIEPLFGHAIGRRSGTRVTC